MGESYIEGWGLSHTVSRAAQSSRKASGAPRCSACAWAAELACAAGGRYVGRSTNPTEMEEEVERPWVVRPPSGKLLTNVWSVPAVLLLLAAAVCLTDAKEEHREDHRPSLGETRPGAT